MTMPTTRTISAPGRICLFGEHQDYLGLPVIAAAVDLRTVYTITPATSDSITLTLPDTGETHTFGGGGQLPYRNRRDYLRSTYNIMLRRGYAFDAGHEISATSRVPIGKGCGSSSAMLVGWAATLAAVATHGDPLSPADAAETAFEAEVTEFREPGGRMDHYSSAFGGIVFIMPGEQTTVRALRPQFPGAIIIGDSLQPKDTTGVIGGVRHRSESALATLQQTRPTARWENLTAADIDCMLDSGCGDEAQVLRANMQNRDITRRALELLQDATPDPHEIGTLLTREHALLTGVLDTSTSRIDDMVAAAVGSGAYGAKINGSGGGGTMFAFAHHEKADAVAFAIESAGGIAIITGIDTGLTEVSHR